MWQLCTLLPEASSLERLVQSVTLPLQLTVASTSKSNSHNICMPPPHTHTQNSISPHTHSCISTLSCSYSNKCLQTYVRLGGFRQYHTVNRTHALLIILPWLFLRRTENTPLARSMCTMITFLVHLIDSSANKIDGDPRCSLTLLQTLTGFFVVFTLTLYNEQPKNTLTKTDTKHRVPKGRVTREIIP